MHCSSCGAPIEAGIRFCSQCGARVSSVVSAAPAVAGGITAVSPPVSSKSKVVAGLLQLFLGAFGAGRFYTGHTGIAIGQIAATWLTCGLGVIWPVVDGILMLVGKVADSDGRPLRD